MNGLMCSLNFNTNFISNISLSDFFPPQISPSTTTSTTRVPHTDLPALPSAPSLPGGSILGVTGYAVIR